MQAQMEIKVVNRQKVLAADAVRHIPFNKPTKPQSTALLGYIDQSYQVFLVDCEREFLGGHQDLIREQRVLLDTLYGAFSILVNGDGKFFAMRAFSSVNWNLRTIKSGSDSLDDDCIAKILRLFRVDYEIEVYTESGFVKRTVPSPDFLASVA